jgi:diacylglycerol kinase family enzyme
VRIALVSNAASGSGPDGNALAAALCERGHQVEHLGLDELPNATGPWERLVAAGGDGSLGPAAAAATRAGATLAVIPAGTANDFARALGLPDDQMQALALASDPSARTQTVDIARADGVPFLNAASWGLSVDAAQAAEPLKGALGRLAYPAGAVRAALRGEPVDLQVAVEGRELFAGMAFGLIVAGTGAFGGGSEIDAADHDDGLLDVAVMPAGSRAGLLRRAAGMRRGDLAEQEDVIHARGQAVDVTTPADRDAANVDGELREPAPRRLTTGEEQVRVVVP